MRYFVEALIALCVFTIAPAWAQTDTDVSGAYYNWQKTMQPERPWLHDYSQTLVMKMFLCSWDNKWHVSKVYLRFDNALTVIRKLDNLTLGIPKIIYLVGWQYSGHDTGYPSWSVVNEHLKRPQDKTALESLKWLMLQARQYHTTVSLHINMHDAYENSPLWKMYDENNIILKDKSGRPIKGYVFAGGQSYQISYAQEWKLGFAQKRIDALLHMLPELQQARTIHIDAFYSVQKPHDFISSPYLGYTIHGETAAQRKILRYWRMKGMDVTINHAVDTMRDDPFIGLVPMAYGFSMEDLHVPGDTESQLKKLNWIGKPRHFEGLPPRLYTGTPMNQAETEIRDDPVHLTGIVQQFCTRVVPWYYRNNPRSKQDDFGTMSDRGDIFLPALWRPSTLVACSSTGYIGKTWRLPQTWAGASNVKVLRITIDGLMPLTTLPVTNDAIKVTLKPGEVIAIER